MHVGTVAVPRVSQPAGFTIPGFYAAHVPYRPSGKTPDPRLGLGCENAEELARLSRLREEAARENAVLKDEALKRGNLFECPHWYVGGNHFPLPREHPLRDRNVKTIRVFADDRVVPVCGPDARSQSCRRR